MDKFSGILIKTMTSLHSLYGKTSVN